MSAAPAKTTDPSMEEILASIRRIIADDDETKPAAEASSAEAPAPSDASPSVIAAVDADGAAGASDDDEVLDLAQAHDARPMPRVNLDIEAPDIQFEAAPERPRRVDSLRAALPPAPPSPAPMPVSPAVQERPASHAKSGQGVGEPQARSSDGIISAEATSSVSQAFTLLSHTIMSQNAQTLEDVVRDMLRPMLKTWLDDNLPPLVERLVAAEIERVARGRR